ncbi:hypothetical protein [Microvirga lotononidis]|uniref:hypothetical protein n=1 Tax=Microvirga lotononidis TaxID=864069 RepID=UPI003899357C
MRKGTVLINTARGEIVDAPALVRPCRGEARRSRPRRAAGRDPGRGRGPPLRRGHGRPA